MIRLIRDVVASCLHVVVFVVGTSSAFLLWGNSVFRKSEWKETLFCFWLQVLKLVLLDLVGLNLIFDCHCGT